MAIDKELVDKLLADYEGPKDLIGEQGLLKQLTKALVERAMSAELTHHLGYEKHEVSGRGSGNSRNGSSLKKLKGDFGETEIAVLRDRNGEFSPQIVAPHQRRFTGFDDKILSLYARGMTTREIQGHLQEIYGVEVSPSLISSVTDAVIEEVKEWQSRPLEPIYPILFLAAGIDRSAQPGGEGYLHCLCGRVAGISASHRGSVSQGAGADLHRAFGQSQPELRQLEGTQAGSYGFESHLPGGECGTSRTTTGTVCRTMGEPICPNCGPVAPAVAAGDSLLQLPGGDPQGNLHYQCGRIAEHEFAQGAQTAGGFPQRRSGVEGHVPGAAQCDRQVATPPSLDRGDEQLYRPMGGSDPQGHWDIVAWFPSPG